MVLSSTVSPESSVVAPFGGQIPWFGQLPQFSLMLDKFSLGSRCLCLKSFSLFAVPTIVSEQRPKGFLGLEKLDM